SSGRVNLARTEVIRSSNVSAYNRPIPYGYVSLRIRSKPVSQRILTRHFWIKRVRIARRKDLVKDFPDRIAIRPSCRTYFHGCHEDPTATKSTSAFQRLTQREPSSNRCKFLFGAPRPGSRGSRSAEIFYRPLHIVTRSLQSCGRTRISIALYENVRANAVRL